MRRLDELHLNSPFLGARRLADHAGSGGLDVGRRDAHAPDGNRGDLPQAAHPASRRRGKKQDYRYCSLSRDRAAHQAAAADISYIPMARGFAYCGHPRSVQPQAAELSGKQRHDLGVLASGLGGSTRARWHAQIFNTDQGSQCTDDDFRRRCGQPRAGGMDGKGRWVAMCSSRLWRSVKYEDIYLHAYATPARGDAGLKRYLPFYNERRGHQSSTIKRRTRNISRPARRRRRRSDATTSCQTQSKALEWVEGHAPRRLLDSQMLLRTGRRRIFLNLSVPALSTTSTAGRMNTAVQSTNPGPFSV